MKMLRAWELSLLVLIIQTSLKYWIDVISYKEETEGRLDWIVYLSSHPFCKKTSSYLLLKLKLTIILLKKTYFQTEL